MLSTTGGEFTGESRDFCSGRAGTFAFPVGDQLSQKFALEVAGDASLKDLRLQLEGLVRENRRARGVPSYGGHFLMVKDFGADFGARSADGRASSSEDSSTLNNSRFPLAAQLCDGDRGGSGPSDSPLLCDLGVCAESTLVVGLMPWYCALDFPENQIFMPPPQHVEYGYA